MNAIHLLLILIATSLNAQQASTITVFRQAGGDTIARAINNNGVIVGSYTPTNNPTQPAGFRRNPDGTIETILYPNATNTQLNGINDQGEIVGNFANNTRAFLRLPNGTFTEITVPDATLVQANAINNNGYIVGAFQRFATSRRPFLRDLAGVPHALAEIITGDVDLLAISNNDNRILLYRANPFSHYASDSTGAFLSFYPSDINRPDGTRLRALNAGNIFGGSTGSPSGVLYRAFGDRLTFQLPGYIGTQIYGINDRNQITGTVRHTDNTHSGFLLTPCTPILPITSRNNGSTAETTAIPLTAPAEGFCLWIADTNTPWIKFTRSLGTGTGSAVYTLEPNTTDQTRTGKITIGASEFTITQASNACQYTVTPTSVGGLSHVAQSLTFTIATGPDCPWNAYSGSPEWIRFPTDHGTGNATITAQVDALPVGPLLPVQRSTQINVAGVNVQIDQRAPQCNYALLPSSVVVDAAGGQRTLQISTEAGCGWSINSSASWITLTGPTTGDGSASLNLNIQPSATNRAGTIILAPTSASIPNRIVTVNQTAVCTYHLPTTSETVPHTQTYRSLYVETLPGCAVSVSTNPPWVRLHPRDPAAPNVSFDVELNTSRELRRADLQIGNATYTLQQSGNPNAGLTFFPLPPCRIMDTRPEEGFSGDHGPPAVSQSAPRNPLPLTGRCGVPATARAVAINVTTVPLNPPLEVFAVLTHGSILPLDPTLSGRTTNVVAQLHVVPVPNVNFYASSPTHVIVDVTGYFAEPTATTGLAFYPLQPCRLHDTRTAGNTPVPGATSRVIPATGQCGIPANAAALSLNLAAIPRGPLDFLTLHPTGQPRPNASTLNAYEGHIIANAALIPTGANGSVSLFASRETDAILDVNGYFAPPSPSALYLTIAPTCRYADSRSSSPALAPGTVHTFASSTYGCIVPTATRAYLLHAAAIPTTPSLAFLSLFPAPTWTTVSTLNAYHGRITANTAIVPNNGSGIGVLVSDPANVVLDLYGFFTP